MLYKVKLKNASDTVLLDEKGYKYVTTDPYLKKVDLVNNLRKHSSGCAVFQKTWKKARGGYKTETIYLHKLIAEKFLSKTKTRKKNLVGAKNGNKLDCRIDNLVYRSRSVASRQRKTSSTTGYTGVYKENKRYRAVISINRKSVHLGMFDTAEEAARAYNKKSKELYGEDGKINVIKRQPRKKAAAKSAPTAKASAKRATKKSNGRSTTAKKTTTRKSTAKSTAAKKSTAKRSTAKKSSTAKSSPKSSAKKSTTSRSTAKKSPAKKTTAAKSSTRKSTTAKKSAPAKKTSAAKKSTTAKKSSTAKKTAAKKTTATRKKTSTAKKGTSKSTTSRRKAKK